MDVGGLMHFWGLTIDTVSCIDVVLAIGLCVDYAAHVGHTFLTERGSRRQRAADTLRDIGPAVFNGGFSTFIAFVFLATSTSHVFITFFKVSGCGQEKGGTRTRRVCVERDDDIHYSGMIGGGEINPVTDSLHTQRHIG